MPTEAEQLELEPEDAEDSPSAEQSDIDYTAMDDEEFLALADSAPVVEPDTETQEQGNEPESDEHSQTDEGYPEKNSLEQDSQRGEASHGDLVEENLSKDNLQRSESAETDSENNSETEEESEPEYLKEYQKILAPFKANGAEMQVKDADEAIQLMQMGANYVKKMQGLSPHLKTLRLLEKHGISDPAKLNYLIDLNDKKPEAISKLIQESGHDTWAVDNEEAANSYTPTEHSISDAEMRLKDVLESLEQTPTYQDLITVCGTQWDEDSRAEIAKEPVILEAINDHMQTGVFEVIQKELIKQRALGNLRGMGDLAAYKSVGDTLQAAGGFNHLFEQSPEPAKPPSKRPAIDDPKRNERRRAASPTKASSSSAPNLADYNPLQMSDEEFEKYFNARI